MAHFDTLIITNKNLNNSKTAKYIRRKLKEFRIVVTPHVVSKGIPLTRCAINKKKLINCKLNKAKLYN